MTLTSRLVTFRNIGLWVDVIRSEHVHWNFKERVLLASLGSNLLAAKQLGAYFIRSDHHLTGKLYFTSPSFDLVLIRLQ